jgi:hypothetical protein
VIFRYCTLILFLFTFQNTATCSFQTVQLSPLIFLVFFFSFLPHECRDNVLRQVSITSIYIFPSCVSVSVEIVCLKQVTTNPNCNMPFWLTHISFIPRFVRVRCPTWRNMIFVAPYESCYQGYYGDEHSLIYGIWPVTMQMSLRSSAMHCALFISDINPLEMRSMNCI